jgi:H+-translocating NAD(P) transhydrogenase subunit alpha
MIVGTLKEVYPGERRVALTPQTVTALVGDGHQVRVETAAGQQAGYPDDQYSEAGASIHRSAGEIAQGADFLAQVHAVSDSAPANARMQGTMFDGLRLIGFANPMMDEENTRKIARTGASLFAVELVPRITRAQSMDALSSMATVSGYKIVLSVADRLPRLFPLLMTAAGTVSAARVLVLGAGVAGLQAIATAKRLGAIVSAYDVRPAVREQVESLGAQFVELDVESESAEDVGGYAVDQGDDFYARQQKALAEVVAEQDAVITTALIPGRVAPTLLTEEMVHGMRPGSIVADLAAERGGNCALTDPGTEVEVGGVTILGPLNIPSSIPYHASQLYSKNLEVFLKHLTDENGQPAIDTEDEITRETLVARGGEVVNERVLEAWKSRTTSEDNVN